MGGVGRVIQRHLHKNWREKNKSEFLYFSAADDLFHLFWIQIKTHNFLQKKISRWRKNEIKEIKGVSVEDTRTCFLGRSW